MALLTYEAGLAKARREARADTEGELLRWAGRVVSAESLDAVFAA